MCKLTRVCHVCHVTVVKVSSASCVACNSSPPLPDQCQGLHHNCSFVLVNEDLGHLNGWAGPGRGMYEHVNTQHMLYVNVHISHHLQHLPPSHTSPTISTHLTPSPTSHTISHISHHLTPGNSCAIEQNILLQNVPHLPHTSTTSGHINCVLPNHACEPVARLTC